MKIVFWECAGVQMGRMWVVGVLEVDIGWDEDEDSELELLEIIIIFIVFIFVCSVGAGE